MESATERHDLIFPPSQFNPTPVTIAGVGAGGSHICLSLAKLGVRNLRIVDNGRVELPNVGPSIYGREHVGQRKVDACATIIHSLSDRVRVKKVHGDVQQLGQLEGIVFICVDDMDVRKHVLLEQCAGRDSKVQRVFEGRMSADFAMSHSLDPRKRTAHVNQWLRFWFPQEEEEPALPGCGVRRVSFNPVAGVIANVMVIQFTQWFAYKRKLLPQLANQVRFEPTTFRMEAFYW